MARNYAQYVHQLDFDPLSAETFHATVKPLFDQPAVVRTA